MKIYFPDDPVKQELLKWVIQAYNDALICSPVDLIPIIEKATDEKIEEVLK